MQIAAPENLVHRGTVAAEAFLLSAKILAEPEMRRRVLLLWNKNVEVFRAGNDLIVRLPEPLRIDTRRSPGLPFVRYGKIFSAFPLAKKDLENFRDVGECFVRLIEGNLRIINRQDLTSEAIETWFDVSDYLAAETETLGETIVESPTLIKQVSEENLNVREELKEVPKAGEGLAEILAKLKKLKENKENRRAGIPFQNTNSQDNSGGSLASFFSSVFDIFKNLFASGNASEGGNAGYVKQNDVPSFNQSTPSALAKFYNRLRHLTVKAVIEMRMAKYFGRRQAKYLAEMMEKFESGDLAEALKYAIPLEDMQVLQKMMEKPTALFLPRPRSSLRINFGRESGGSSINLKDEWFNRLRELYRQSFERLERENRIEEAAFVLAELLKSNHEAVEFLAKHGKYKLAAELAEARGLPKEAVVRHWFLAGEKTRAVRLAILYGCFEYAVMTLEKQNSDAASELRQIWAESLADSGNFAAAVDVIWKLEGKRERAEDWIEKTIEFGGAPAARMLARKTMLFPERFEEIKEKFREILSGTNFESVEKRNAFARAVFKQKTNVELQTLLRPLIRKILADAQNSAHGLALKEFRELVVMAKDNALRTDLPKFPQAAPPVEPEKFVFVISADDRGASCIFDACILPDGKIALALGEAGVKILSRDGKQIAHFDQPAQKLVVSDFSTKAVAIARRGETVRLAKINFLERRAWFWCDAKIDAFASDFDGDTWLVGIKDEFYAIDANAESFEAVWRVPEVGGGVCAVTRSEKQVKFLTLNAKGFETWWYETSNLTLRSRNQRNWLENAGESSLYAANVSGGGLSVVIMQEQSKDTNRPRFYADFFDYEHQEGRFGFPPETKRLYRPEIFNQYAVLASYKESEAQIDIFHKGINPVATFILEAAQSVSTKFVGDKLIIADDCGRLLVFDYNNRLLQQNMRL